MNPNSSPVKINDKNSKRQAIQSIFEGRRRRGEDVKDIYAIDHIVSVQKTTAILIHSGQKV